MGNKTATALKVISLIVGTIGVIGTMAVATMLNSDSATRFLVAPVVIVTLFSGVISALLLYAFGEVIQLLQDIKDRTGVTAERVSTPPKKHEGIDESLPKL
ncbi:hypothetical protein FACS1894171_2120 [Clostridia bacterium]|nr:hypothetical protein FACS1894171_2120 [Clostridia bacterium]